MNYGGLTMRDNVIYYPYVRIPKNEWFNQAVLYWDKLYTMTTRYHYGIWNHYNSYEEKLVRYGLVDLIKIGEFLGRTGKLDDFLEYVDDPEYPIPRDPNKWEGSVSMFREKMEWDPEVLSGLEERGLVSRSTDDWYRVEAYTAKQYMAFLAGAIGEYSEINANAITDRQIDLESFVETGYQKDSYQIQKNYARDIVLEDILPAPRGTVDLEKLAKFKDKNKDELLKFREHLEKKIIKIASIPDQEDRKNCTEQLIKDEKSNIKELEDQMSANGWSNTIRSTLKTLAVPLAGMILAPPTMGFSIIPTFLGWGTIGADNIRKKMKKDKKLKEDRHFYLLALKKEFTNPITKNYQQRIKQYVNSFLR